MRRSNYFKLLLALAAIGLLIFFNQSASLVWTRIWILKIFKPMLSIASDVSIALNSGINGESENGDADSRRLKILNFELEHLKEENKNLRSALAFEEESGVLLYGAKVVSYQQEFGKEFLLVDTGKDILVTSGIMTVDSDGVLIGFVKEVTGDFLKIEIASNSGLTSEIEIIPGRAKAIAKGLGSRAFSIELLPQDSSVRAGDFMAVFKPPFPSLLLGGIVSVETHAGSAFQDAKAVMIARPEILRELFLVLPR